MKPVIHRLGQVARVIFHPVHLRRTGSIAAAVGTWLTLVNQGDVLVAEHWSTALVLKIALNYLTPFTVSNLGLLSRTFDHPMTAGLPATAARKAPLLNSPGDRPHD